MIDLGYAECQDNINVASLDCPACIPGWSSQVSFIGISPIPQTLASKDLTVLKLELKLSSKKPVSQKKVNNEFILYYTT